MTPVPPLLTPARKRGLALVSFLVLLQGGAMGLAAFATRALFDAMHQETALPALMLAALVLSGVATATVRVLARRAGERLGQDYARSLRRALFDHAARMPVRAVATRRTGYMSLRFVGDMTAFRNWLALGLPRLIAALVMVPCALIALALMAPLLALVVLPILSFGIAVILLAGWKLLPLHQDLRQRRASIAADMAERMPLAPHLDMLGRRRREARQMNRQLSAMIEVALRRITWAEALKAVPDLMAGAAAAAVIVAGFRSGISPGTIAGALAALGLLLQPMRDLGSLWNLRAAHRAAQQKLSAALSRAQRPKPAARRALPKGALTVALHQVALPSGQEITCRLEAATRQVMDLEPIDFASLCDVIQRLDEAPSGEVMLGERPLQDLSAGSLRRRIGRIDGAAVILQGSLRRVLTLGLEDRPSDARLLRLVERCHLSPLLDRLGGLDGRISEGGRMLSLSERVLISWARVRLRKPGLLLIGPEVRMLDDQTRARLMRYVQKREATVISTIALPFERKTNDMNEARAGG